MADRARHLEAAASNKALGLSIIGPGENPPWAIVLAYYSALHLIDAYLDYALQYHPHWHPDRIAVIHATTTLRPIFADYELLETRSREARYDLLPFTTTQAQAIYDGALARIESHIRPLLP